MVTRIFNIITIVTLLTFIMFVTAFFFLGSYETFETQLNDLPEYFFKRAAGGFVIGLLGCVIIGSGNLLLRKKQTDRLRRTYKILLLTVVLSAICSITGTAIFFFL
jgi:hypothetical protein